MNRKKEGARYCGLTMQRQLDTNDYNAKDWIYNAINLSEYYAENQWFSQTEYLLLSALSLVPKDDENKLSAVIQMTLGKAYLELMKFLTVN